MIKFSKKRKIKDTITLLFIFLFMIFVFYISSSRPRVFILQSYNTDYSWSRDVDIGINNIIGKYTFYNVRRHYMDTKNHPSEDYKINAGIVARRVIRDYDPDVLIAVDDDAQEYVAKYFINHPNIAIVFSGVNGDLKKYGYHLGNNVTGILERLPLKEIRNTLLLLAEKMEIKNKIRAIHISDRSGTVISDDNYINNFQEWDPIIMVPSRLIESFSEWKQTILESASYTDFIIISNYRKLYDDSKKLVPPKQVMEWTVQNSPVPIIGANAFVVEDGANLAVATSPYEQGEIAAKLAVQIIRDHRKPSDLSVAKTQQFIICMREKIKNSLPDIYQAFAKATNKFWPTEKIG